MAGKSISILYVVSTLNIGGTELQLKLLVEGLDKTAFQPVICAITTGGPLEEEYQRMNVPVYILGKKHKLDFSILPKLKKVISIHKPLIMHSFLFTANFWGRWGARKEKVPVIISSERSLDTYKNFVYWWIDQRQSIYTDKIIANAQAVKSFIVTNEKINPDLVKVISNGLNLKSFNEALEISEETRKSIKDKYKIANENFIIGNVCRISPLKDLETFIQAAALVKKEISSTRFVMVGDAVLSDELPYKEKILNRLEQLNLAKDFVLPGKSNEIPQWLSTFDVFVQSSVTEGFPNAVMEAMAMAKPVVATDVGGTSELVIHEQTGYLVPPKDPKQMAKRIIELHKNPELREKMGQSARKRILEQYSAEKMVENTQNLYTTLLRQKGLL